MSHPVRQSVPFRALAGLGGVVLALAAAGCGGEGRGETPPEAVAVIDGEPVRVEDVERYLSSVLGVLDEEGSPADADMDLVKSRLFDDFIEEEILVHEALHRGIQVTEAEVDAYLAAGVEGGAQPDEVDRRLARRNLLIHELRARELGAGGVSDERVEAYLAEHREDLVTGRRLVMRSIAVSNESDAARIRREILRGDMDFAEAVEVFGEEGDRGRAVEIPVEDLPEEIRAVVADLASGDVSKPVTYQERAWLFLIERGAADAGEDELRRQARRELERRDIEDASARLLREARGRARVTLFPSRLPFDYVEESDTP